MELPRKTALFRFLAERKFEGSDTFCHEGPVSNGPKHFI